MTSARRRRTRKVGIREAKAKLSQLIREVREGGTIEVTDRGKPVARIVPAPPALPDPLDDSYEAVVERLLAAGHITERPPKKRPRLPPLIKLKGKIDLQKMLREDRDAR